MHVPHRQRPAHRRRGARPPRVRADAAVRKRLKHPFFDRGRRDSIEGNFTPEELGLALNNVSLPPEALRYDVTPLGLHYTLSHFDIPALRPSHRLTVDGTVERPRAFQVQELRALGERTVRVTMECAGNGRAGMAPRYPSMPWTHGAVGTADWTGTPLSKLLAVVKPRGAAVEIAFHGADHGFDSGVEHPFARSLRLQEANDDVIVAWAMNGQPLLPQHGAPLRLVVPGWFGMASVKWLERIELREQPFDGYQQVTGYRYKKKPGEDGVPVRHMKVKSLMQPPGIPDWYTRRRLVEQGTVPVEGRAWSGGGVAVTRVELAVDGDWRDAELDPPSRPFAWQRWRAEWDARPGEHELACRATDARGDVQPLEPDWNMGGMGNNAVQRMRVTVR
ncbi:MAG TPA: sulfite oxidase [Burkholderiales bacterium]|nr:sulfite oxidase [Burkholderiales bacterium]